jgi:hypothetical protein
MSFENTSSMQSIEFNINNLGRMITATLVGLCLVFMISGCGFFGENDYEREQREEKQTAKKQAEQKKNQVKELENKFNATYFPPKEISYGDFTYKYQQYFRNNKGKNIIFKGDVDDIWSEKDSIYIEFVCTLTDSFNLVDMILNDYKDGIVFRLKAGEKDVQNVKNKLDDYDLDYDFMNDLYEQYSKEHYLIVAQISNVVKGRIFEHSASGYGEDIEVEMDKAKNVIAYGKLVAYEEYEMELVP